MDASHVSENAMYLSEFITAARTKKGEQLLFWRLTVKAKTILLIQRDKLRADRLKTHGMLGL